MRIGVSNNLRTPKPNQSRKEKHFQDRFKAEATAYSANDHHGYGSSQLFIGLNRLPLPKKKIKK